MIWFLSHRRGERGRVLGPGALTSAVILVEDAVKSHDEGNAHVFVIPILPSTQDLQLLDDGGYELPVFETTCYARRRLSIPLD